MRAMVSTGRCLFLAGLVVSLLPGMSRLVNAAARHETTEAQARIPIEYIDTMIREAWEAAEVEPSARASEAEFVRRAYLDIVGRIPTVAEASSYLQNNDPGKRLKLVEYLLADPDYPKYFANLWSVILTGRRQQNRQFDRQALTSWLRRQFADNRPWNVIARELITAQGSNKENGAVNFTLAHMDNDAVPLTSLTTRVFLGQQIQCTQCHDHPSNDWKQEDFWGINAFFKGLRRETVRTVKSNGVEVDDYTQLSEEPTDDYARYERRNGELRIAFPAFLDGSKIDSDANGSRRTQLGAFITSETNADFPRALVNRLWAHFMGRGFVHPVDDFGPHNPPSHPDLLDRLAEDFVSSGYDLKALIRWITASEAYNLTSMSTPRNEKDEVLFSHMALKPMNPEQLFDSLLIATAAHKAGGDAELDSKREQWLSQFLFTFGNDEGEEGSTFEGTIPQALMMMNGDLMERAVGGRPGSFLAQTLEQARLQRKFPPEVYALNRIYMAALSRPPRRDEITRLQRMASTYPDKTLFLQDVFWALLNSNEFILNH